MDISQKILECIKNIQRDKNITLENKEISCYQHYMDFVNNIDNRQLFKQDEIDILKEAHSSSFINFLRYYIHLLEFKDFVKYIAVFDELISISFFNPNTQIELSLTFQKDGITKFISMDSDEIQSNEKMTYLMQGSISTSSLFSKSHKIKRILNILK